MKKIISFFVIVVCLLLTIQLTSCGDKTDSPEVPVVPENPDKPDNPDTPESPDIPEDSVIISNLASPGDDKYYDSYKQTIDELGKLIESGAVSSNEQLIEAAKKYDNIIHTFEKDSLLYLYFEGGWTYMADFEGVCTVDTSSDDEYDDSLLEEYLAELHEFIDSTNNNSSPTKFGSRSSENPSYIISNLKVLFWAPFDDRKVIYNYYNTIFDRLSHLKFSKIKFDHITGNQCSVNDISKFGEYDIVIFNVHGAHNGVPIVPNDLKGLTYKGNSACVAGKDCKFLDKNYLNKIIPSLDKTIFWTLMCFSYQGNSILENVVKQKSAGDYFGATDEINAQENRAWFIPFLINIYAGGSSAKSFIPEGGQWIKYFIVKSNGHIINGEYGHEGYNGICFPLTEVYKAVDNKPSAFWQAPTGEIDKVAKGTGHFKAGIEVKNTKTSKTTKIELKEDNIESTQKKPFKKIIERNTYIFKTDGLEAGTYEYRSYIEFPNGDIKYSNDTYTFEIYKESDKYFELYLGLKYQANKKFALSFNNEVENVHVICDNNSDLNVKFDKTNSELSFNAELGIHKYTFYYEGTLKEINHPYYNSDPSLYGGYIPDPVSIDFSKLRGWFNEVSLNKKGDDILTLPHIQNLKIAPDLEALVSIDLSGCSDLNSIGELTSFELKHLKLNNCKNLTEIGEFRYCTSLQDVDLGNCSKLTELTDRIFDKCSSLNSINLKGCSALSRIGFEAFKDCSSLKFIDFSGCSSLKHISRYAFFRCSSLKSINFNDCSNLEIIEHHAFMDCNALSSLDLSPCAKLKELAKEIFADCSSLSSINFNECLQLIESGAFYYCSKLNTIDLSGCPNLISIQSNAFGDCTNLSKVILPAKVISVYGAFRACPIKIAYCYSPNPSYGNPFPRNIDNYAKIYVPASSVGIYQENWGVWEEDNRGNRIRCLNIFPM